ncbi:MAG: rhomboid family intramembrane serine protease [Chloroflexota bacterium]|nr:rhomboid family intramembrane serine protease [Chloroflexota bacterium]
MTNEPDKENKEANQEYSPLYPGYPRPSSVQPPSNYPYPTSNPNPGDYTNPPPSFQEPPPRAWLEAQQRERTPEVPPQEAPLPLPLHTVMVTYALLAMIAIMYVVSIVADGGGISFSHQFSSETLVKLGALYSPLVTGGEWWRLVTVMFLHANAIHILLNGLNFYILGKQLEALFGPARYTMIFFLSGLTGSIASYGLHDQVLAVGASGAIFGLLGATIGYFLRQRDKFGVFGRSYLKNLLATAALNFVLLLLIPGVDNLAHGGGLVGGLVLGYLCSPLYDFSQTPNRRLRITQRDNNNLLWLGFALAWLALIVVAFFFFLNAKLA